MEYEAAKRNLRKRLRDEVARFYRRDDRVWKGPVVDMLRALQQANIEAVFFGGTLRSLLVSRIHDRKQGRPRDVDIVVSGTSIDALKEFVADKVERETRFGGLQVREREWQFDIWPLQRTWAFVEDDEPNRAFASLPRTTFFNMEAIAVEIWPRPGKPRRIFTGDDQFFDGFIDRTLEINREENPFPHLCVIRALVMASNLDFSIGPRLAGYIAKHGGAMTSSDVQEVQQSHYGKERRSTNELLRWITHVADAHDKGETARLPMSRQMEFWPESEAAQRLRLYSLSK